MISDEAIAEKVNEKLVKHPKIEAGDIWVYVESGDVTLSGSVADEKTKAITEKVVENIRGVNNVDNLLESIESQREHLPFQPDSPPQKQSERQELKQQKNAMTNEGGPDILSLERRQKMNRNANTKRNEYGKSSEDLAKEEAEARAEENKKHGGSSQFRYDTPFNGGSAYDKAAIKAAKEGKWIANDQDVEEGKQEVKRELGETQ